MADLTANQRVARAARVRWICAAALLLAAIALLVSAWRTRDSVASLQAAKAQRSGDKTQVLVDTSPLTVARQLSSEACLPDEQPLASEALRLSDHEVDQAFATALRDSLQPATSADHKAEALEQQATALAAKVKNEAAEAARLQAAEAGAKDADDAAEATELAQTQLSLDQDDLEDLQQLLNQSGGDRHGQLEQALKSHEQLEEKPPPSAGGLPPLDTLARRYSFWLSLRQRRAEVDSAKAQTASLLDTLTQRRAARPGTSITSASAGTSPQGQTAQTNTAAQTAPAPATDRAAAIAHLKVLALERQTLTEYDRRLEDTRQLSVVYGKWSQLLAERARLQVHYMLQTAAWLLLVLIVAIVLDGLVRAYFHALPAERSWQRNLRVFLLALIYALSSVTALVLVFGKPSEFETLLGLVGAGLTVALKDFIVGFLGWFFLAGSNGVRVGDWVEIEGVAGEVVEIGLLRTVLLESGNWTETGHPTGRRVSFLNTYAVQGHYFNYTTHGQWLWDEILVPLPNDASMYRVAEELDTAMQAETAKDAEAAAQEWDRVSQKYGVGAFSPRPTVDVRPGASGPEAVIRYVTQAACRAATRARLNAAAMRVLRAPVQPGTG